MKWSMTRVSTLMQHGTWFVRNPSHRSTWKKVGRWWTLQAGTSFAMADGRWFQALCFSNTTDNPLFVDDFVHFYAPCCTFIGISRLISHVWLPEGTVPVLFGGYGMPVQYEAKGSKHALSIIDSTKWTRVLSQLVAVARLKVRLNCIANGELQIKNYRQNVKDFDQSSDRFLVSLLLFT